MKIFQGGLYFFSRDLTRLNGRFNDVYYLIYLSLILYVRLSLDISSLF